MAARPIKFRAWDREARVIREVLNLSFNELNEISEITVKIGEAYQIGDDNEEEVLAGIPCDCGLGKFELMQFTGLLDKNGKEIYEGDIVIDHDDNTRMNYQIEWMEGCWFMTGIEKNDELVTVLLGRSDPSSDVEVIGNIYENPELIEMTSNQAIRERALCKHKWTEETLKPSCVYCGKEGYYADDPRKQGGEEW